MAYVIRRSNISVDYPCFKSRCDADVDQEVVYTGTWFYLFIYLFLLFRTKRHVLVKEHACAKLGSSWILALLSILKKASKMIPCGYKGAKIGMILFLKFVQHLKNCSVE